MEELRKNEIGELAGRMWKYLSANGKTSFIKLKAEFGTGNSMIFLAAGWLARENKIIIERENTDYYAWLTPRA